MIIVSYHVNTAGVLYQYSDNHFILKDSPVGFKDCPELNELMSRGGNVGGGEFHIPETPVTIALFNTVKKKVKAADLDRRDRNHQRERRRREGWLD